MIKYIYVIIVIGFSTKSIKREERCKYEKANLDFNNNWSLCAIVSTHLDVCNATVTDDDT